MAPTLPAPQPATDAVPPRRRRAWPAALALALLATLALPPAALWALLRSEAGSAWLLARVPGLTVQGAQGALLGERFSAERLQWQGAPGRLALQQLALEGLRWQWRPAPGLWLGLQFEAVSAAQLQWLPAEGRETAPPQPPASLRLPLSLQAPLHIGRLQVGGAPALQDLRANLALGADAGARHRIDGLALRWAGGQAGGALAVQADAPMALALQATLQSLPGVPRAWHAELLAEGPLQAPTLRARLAGLDDAAHADLEARLAPFAPFPLAALRLQTQDLDLSRLDPRLPETRLAGSAELVEPVAGRPLQARVALDNTRPGRWNERRLPLRSAQLDVQAAPDTPGQLALRDIRLALADAAGPAGRVSGSGEWSGSTLTLELQAQALVPQRLDGRAPPWRVDGAFGLEVGGLPSPDPAAPAPAGPWQAVLALALSGRHTDFPQPVFVQAQARAAADTLALDRLLARAGPAEARASGRARRAGAGWALAGDAALRELDPVAWWPGLGDTWRRGPHRLNATLALDLQATAAGDWRSVGGSATLAVADSALAGVPLAGRAALEPDGRLTLTLDAGGNRADATLQPDRRPGGIDDAWALRIDAPGLAALAPWQALHPALAGLPRAGRLQAEGRLQGRWPALQGEGRAEAQGLAAGPLSLGEATLQWTAGAAIDAPLRAQAQVSALQWGSTRLRHAQLQLDGSLADHRLQVDAALPLLPPPALARTLGLPLDQGTRLAGRLDGRLQREGEGWHWQGRLQQLGAGPWDGRWTAAGIPAPAAPAARTDWLQAQPLAVDLRVDGQGRLQQLRADAGRLRLGDALWLAWDELRLSAGALQWQARLEDLPVAPLLARWQPDMGWEGNLRIGGTLALSLDERTRVDIVLERRGGDLGVRESPELSIPLGLSDLRLALQAQDGEWTFTQALAGRALGELGGVVRVRTTPQARWPAAGDPLDGALAGRVANLGVWGAWVPAGWRLQGAVSSEVRLSGRLGAPELRGTLGGQGLGVRNLLQGVHVRDGEVLLRLEGERATVERFELRGGEGRLTLSGGATLGAEPRADLALRAERFQLLSRIDRRLSASGSATLALAPQSLTLRGQLAVDDGLFDASRADAPSLDDDVVVRRADAPPADASTAAAPPRQRRTDVAVDIDLGPSLRVRGRGLDTRLAGRLRVSAPAGRLAVHGTVNAVDGTYAAYAQKLEIRRGVLAFSGEPGNPRLDVLALRPNVDIEVGVAITGSVQAPRVRLHSNPELSETDKLSWLVLGRDPGGLGRADTALLQRAAVALLAGEGEAPTDTLMRNLGLDEFSVRQDEDGSGTGDTIVSLGKQLSRRWYLGYERGVNATVGTWQLIYRAAQRFTLRAQSGAENSLDAIWIWRVP